MKKMLLGILLGLLMMMNVACRGKDDDASDMAPTELFSYWIGVLEDEAANVTIEFTYNDGENEMSMIQKRLGNEAYHGISSDDFSMEEYIVAENGERFVYTRYGDGDEWSEWFKNTYDEVFYSIIDEFFENAIQVGWFDVQDRTFTLKSAHFVDLFDDDSVNVESFVITIADHQMTWIIVGAGEDEGMVVTIVAKHIGTTSYSLPDFSDYVDSTQ